MIHNLTSKDEFQNFIINYKNVIVDFWSTRCGPCRVLHNILQNIKNDDVQIGALNIDHSVNDPQLSSMLLEYDIDKLPVLIYFTDGKEVKRSVGLVSADEIKKNIEELQK